MRPIAVLALLFVALSCRREESLSLPLPAPPHRPIFAGNWASGGGLQHMEKPRYPRDLRYLGVQTVVLTGTILENGTLTGIMLLHGSPLLFPAARNAVSKWRYQPVRLYDPNTGRSTPTPVITQIALRFEP